MHALKSVARRGSIFAVAGVVLAVAAIPTAAVFADALNPLTERSLMLSSSAPGYIDTDGSGNSNAAPNFVGENYAPAGSGPNGKKTGETFTFNVSSTATIKGFSLQYCTVAAGWCRSPGDNTGDADPNNDGDTADSTRQANAGAGGGHESSKSDFDFVSAFTQGSAATAPAAGQFQIFVDGVATSVTGWSFTKENMEDTQYAGHAGTLTGKNNYVTLTNATGISLTNGQEVQIVFEASESIYLTNPGSGSFFVKINTYNSDTSLVASHNDTTRDDNTDAPSHTVIDGGVTVANVMTDSIHITTKVLETMAFSVGTRNRDTVVVDCLHGDANSDANDTIPDCEGNNAVHGTCSPIQVIDNNRLNLGNPDAEYSLETGKAWDVYSYWRLSSNSSGGATVYYSGNTLANTVGDEVAEMTNEAVSTPGTEQFGLGFVDVSADPVTGHGDDLAGDFEDAVAAPDSRYKVPNSAPLVTVLGQSGAQYAAGQTAQLAYDEATGTIDDGAGNAGTAKFKFLKSSLTVPEPISQQNTDVISCATAKMRYVANIGADTPAGVYTTKVNYLAAPQY